MINFEIPYWLRSIGGKVAVATKRPSDVAYTGGDTGMRDSQFDMLINGMQDAIHSVINNTCRECGLEMEGADSEQTYDWCAKLGAKIEEFIREEWKRQDEQEKHRTTQEANDAQLLQSYLARVNQARKRAGLPVLTVNEEPTPPPTGVPST